jgi:hypothetical protein
MIPEAAPSAQITGRARADSAIQLAPFERLLTFLRTLLLIWDKNSAICFPFGDVYPLNFLSSGDRGNSFQLGFMFAIPSPRKSSRAHISLSAHPSSMN